MEQTFSCDQDIRGDRERVGERSCKWRECVGKDNGDEQVRKVVLFRPRANEILQKQ